MSPIVPSTQVVFVDLQVSLVARSRTNPPDAIAAAAGALASSASVLGLPMTFLTVPRDAGPDTLLPELRGHATDGNTFSRAVTGPFLVPGIASALRAHGRKTILVAGFTTEVAVLQTSLAALAEGYEVFVPVDAVGSRSERTEAAAFREIEGAGGVTSSVRGLLLRLAPDLGQPPGSTVMALLGSV